MPISTKEQNGFTLVEVMAALAIAFVIVDAGYQFLRFSHGQLRSGQARQEVLDAGRQISARLRMDLINSRTIRPMTDRLLLITVMEDTVLYRYQQNSLWRNQTRLHSDAVEVNSMAFSWKNKIDAVSASTAGVLLCVVGEVRSTAYPFSLPISVAIFYRNRSPELE